jgi:hypothetical protein
MSSSINKPGCRAGGNMIRISLSFFYGLGAILRPLSTVTANMKLRDVWSPVYQAHGDLASLFSADWFMPAVKAAAGPGNLLLATLKSVTDRTDFDEGEISYAEAYEIQKRLTDFETVLRSELLITDSYFVSRKAGYDTAALISNGEQNFPVDLGTKVPLAIGDIREAGKCLAFELSTAAGFHVLRATETVVRNYWTAVTKGAAHPKPRTLGTYLRRLEEKKLGSKKTIETLKQITALHRNPLMHPEESLTLEDAIGLFGICRSGIGAMLKEIPTPLPGIFPPVPPLP